MTAAVAELKLGKLQLAEEVEEFLREPRHMFCGACPPQPIAPGVERPAFCGALAKPLGLMIGHLLPPEVCEPCARGLFAPCGVCGR